MQRQRAGSLRMVVLLAGFLALVAPGPAAFAQQMVISPHGIPYASGGVGADERAIMQSLASHYNLRLQFADRSGHFLGDVWVMLQGPTLLQAMSDGPLFMANLPPGTYRLTVTASGVPQERTVTLRPGQPQSLAFFW